MAHPSMLCLDELWTLDAVWLGSGTGDAARCRSRSNYGIGIARGPLGFVNHMQPTKIAVILVLRLQYQVREV